MFAVTSVRLELADSPEHPRLLAYAGIVLDDCFIVRDMRVVEGNQGLFVSMPSRKRMNHCPDCKGKNALMAGWCNWCGKALERPVVNDDLDLYADVAHPLTTACREFIKETVLAAYEKEIGKPLRTTEVV